MYAWEKVNGVSDGSERLKNRKPPITTETCTGVSDTEIIPHNCVKPHLLDV